MTVGSKIIIDNVKKSDILSGINKGDTGVIRKFDSLSRMFVRISLDKNPNIERLICFSKIKQI